MAPHNRDYRLPLQRRRARARAQRSCTAALANTLPRTWCASKCKIVRSQS